MLMIKIHAADFFSFLSRSLEKYVFEHHRDVRMYVFASRNLIELALIGISLAEAKK